MVCPNRQAVGVALSERISARGMYPKHVQIDHSQW